MKQKLYIHLDIIQKGSLKQTHQLIRVDDVKEFAPILYGQQASEFFISQKMLIDKGQLVKAEPFRVAVPEPIFDLLKKEINRKIGSIHKVNATQLKIVQGSQYLPCIEISIQPEPIQAMNQEDIDEMLQKEHEGELDPIYDKEEV